MEPPGALPDIVYNISGYVDLSPAQPTFYRFGFNFDTDLGMLNPKTGDTYATSLDIRRFVDYGHEIIWVRGLSDPAVPVLGNIKYYEEMAQQFGGLEPAQQFSRFYPIPNMGPGRSGDRPIRPGYATRQLG